MAIKKDKEKSSRGKRIKRYASVTTKMGGVTAKLAAERYLGVKTDRAKTAKELRAALGGLKGPLMKVAQILATIPDAIPPEYVGPLRELQANAPPMGWPFVRRRMIAEMGPDWEKKFKSFGHEAAAAASLGQVHKATSKTGIELACKLQYPDMQSAVEADLKQLKMILGVYKRIDGAIDTSEVHQEISDRLREELDYEREARNMNLYRDILKDQPIVHIPKPFPELSTKRLLTMTWLEGDPILDFVDAKPKMRNELAMNMFRAWYVPFYHYGIIHADPHLGNYTIRKNGDINLLDFGCVRVFRPEFVHGVIELYQAMRDNDMDQAAHAYKIWGFKNLSKELMEVLNIWANFLYSPILQDKIIKMSDSNSGEYGRETAAKVHRELKRVGGVKPPREFVFMDRAAVGLGSVFLHLKAEMNWYRLFHDLIGGFDVKELQQQQKSLLQKHKITANG
jgi:predicted unusual protein kinase regulating ubiquinone biosynthesis (AarF/ABC1/UbiB family)